MPLNLPNLKDSSFEGDFQYDVDSVPGIRKPESVRLVTRHEISGFIHHLSGA